MGTSFRKFSQVFAKEIIQVAIYPDENQLKSAVDKYIQTNYKDHVSFCKFLQGFALFIFSFRVFCFCFFWFIFKIFFINLFYFGTLREQNPYFLALCKKTNPDFFGTSRLFWHFARTFSQFLNLQERELFREIKMWDFVYFFLLVCLHFLFFHFFFFTYFFNFI